MKKLKHSGLGIVSLIASIVSIIIFVFMFVIGLMEAALDGHAQTGAYLPVSAYLPVLFITASVALGCGIAGLFQKERLKKTAVIGTVLSAGAIIMNIGIMIIGMAMDYLFPME